MVQKMIGRLTILGLAVFTLHESPGSSEEAETQERN